MTRLARVAVALVAIVVIAGVCAIFAETLFTAPHALSPGERACGRSMAGGGPASAGALRMKEWGAATPIPAPVERARASVSPRHEPSEVLAARAPADFVATARGLGFAVVETLSLRRLDERVHRVRLPSGVDVPAGIAKLRSRFPRAVVDANHHFTLAQGMDLPASFARASIGWEAVPADCGTGIRIGMIDAAIDTGHPALQGADLEHHSFATPGRTAGSAEHGTAIATLLIGRPDAGRGWGGLLPGAHLAAASIFETNAHGESVATARALLQAVEWMAGQDVDVVNLSMAGPENAIVRLATERALQQGLVLVAAAGNGAKTAEPAYPAAYPDVIAVTAVSADGRAYDYANRGSYIDFAAPGVRLWTAVPRGGRFQSGTSFAAPYVTAMSALALVNGTTRHADAVRSRLRETAIDLGLPGRDDVFGWGLVRMNPVCPGSARRAPVANRANAAP
jgi:hypothetical protein